MWIEFQDGNSRRVLAIDYISFFSVEGESSKFKLFACTKNPNSGWHVLTRGTKEHCDSVLDEIMTMVLDGYEDCARYVVKPVT